MKEYKYILLDLDGTITDPMIGITRCVEYALNHFSIQVNDLRELCPFIGPPLLDSFRDFYHSQTNRLKRLQKNTGNVLPTPAFMKTNCMTA